MCDNQSLARRNNPANDNPQGSFYHADFRSATPMCACGSSATPMSHEQGHYDIAGLCYRRMGRELSALRAGTGEALDSEVASIKQTANRGAKQLNTRYDNVIRDRPRFMGKKCVVINEVSSDWFALKELLHNY